MKPMTTISGVDALVRAAVVVVGAVLLVLVVAGVLKSVGTDARTVILVVLFISCFAAIGGVLLISLWALAPWLVRRAERRLWEGKVKLDQAEMLRLSGLSDRRSMWPYSRGPR
ncbi:MAG TPA: hypothetical protein PK282_02670 [Rhodoglobus sp.]|nr:hypothetical protein [Rhodoglobus sp.]